MARTVTATDTPPARASLTATPAEPLVSRTISFHERQDYVDGLRGVAIAMVLIYHAWLHHGWLDQGAGRVATAFDRLANIGYQGVTLFLVLSGFCLSYPLWRRRRAGAADWFTPSLFFARRCLRILPPYYVALALFSAIIVLRDHGLRHLGAINLVSHVLLLHTLTPYHDEINASFWSLGLEWQWYWLFPLVLALCLWSPWRALALCLAAAVFWHAGTHDLWSLSALPARLFEFCAGVVAARMVVSGHAVPVVALALAALAAPLAYALSSVLPIPLQDVYGRGEPLWGLGFAALVLLGSRRGAVFSALSWSPLALLGVASYSVYLVHEPLVATIDKHAPLPLRNSPLVMVVAIVAALVAGMLFHLAVERPFMRAATQRKVVPALTALFGWTDWTWEKVRHTLATPAATPRPDVQV